jgi:hypothetical protein
VTFLTGAPTDSVTLTWGAAQQFSKVMIRELAPWGNSPGAGASVMTKNKLEYWYGSGWLPCPTVAKNHSNLVGAYSNTTAVSTLGYFGGEQWTYTFYDGHWCHNVDFAVSVTTTKLRWTITAASYGHLPGLNAAAYAPYGYLGDTNPGVRVLEIQVFQNGPPPTAQPYFPHL